MGDANALRNRHVSREFSVFATAEFVDGSFEDLLPQIQLLIFCDHCFVCHDFQPQACLFKDTSAEPTIRSTPDVPAGSTGTVTPNTAEGVSKVGSNPIVTALTKWTLVRRKLCLCGKGPSTEPIHPAY
jgi:hypothetical protein